MMQDVEFVYKPKRSKPRRNVRYNVMWPMIMSTSSFIEWMRSERRRGKEVKKHDQDLLNLQVN